MALVFVGSACIPCSSMMEPRNFTEVLKNWHFSMLRLCQPLVDDAMWLSLICHVLLGWLHLTENILVWF